MAVTRMTMAKALDMGLIDAESEVRMFLNDGIRLNNRNTRKHLYHSFKFMFEVCVAVCCSVLQCVAVCCSVLQCGAVWCSVLQCVAVCCSMLQCVAMCCNVVQCGAVCCSVVQCGAERCKYIAVRAM